MEYMTLPHDHGQAMEKALDDMPSPEMFQNASDIFKQLGDASRLRIFWLLCPMVQMSSPAVSHHLKQLRAGDLIISRREGKEVYYKAADTPQARLLHRMIEELMETACPTAAR